jgi:hypothetical protein
MAAFAMGGAAPPAHAAPELEPCGAGALCGSISVPLDRTGATPGRIRIHFELYRRTDRTRARLGTLMAAEGGPGYSTTESRDYYLTPASGCAAAHSRLPPPRWCRSRATSGRSA